MSQADIDRFVADLKSDASLLEGLKGEATGLASVVEFAKGKGYDVSVEEAKSYVSTQAGQDLSDEQLDAISGGAFGDNFGYNTETGFSFSNDY